MGVAGALSGRGACTRIAWAQTEESTVGRHRTNAAETERDRIERRLASERGATFSPGGPRVAMLYPSPYRAGMSSLGYQWVLQLLRDAGFAAERAFLPDDATDWTPGERRPSPLLTYETGSPLTRFPVVAVSLAYELELAGLVRALELAGIPPLRRDRSPHHPLVLLGGPLTFSNPLPAAPFVDAMLLGEADDVVVGAVSALVDAHGDAARAAALLELSRLPGGFVPELHGTRLPEVAKASDLTLPARGAICAPEAELRDMFLIEGERGCHRQCTFCVMRRSTNGGMRLVTPERVLSYVPDYAPRVGLVGAAISDHPKLLPLLETIVGSGRGVGVSSLRADRIARRPGIARILREGGATTLTVASDAASQRLRRTIAKGTTERHLVRVAELAAEHRFKQLKVYMMLGVPDEADEDLDELIAFTVALSKIQPVALGVAPFVAKRNTPLDGAAFAGVKTVERRIQTVQRALRKQSRGRAQLRPTSARWAWVEYMLAQGGPLHGEAVLQAVHAGGRFADWKRALQAVPTELMRPWAQAPPVALPLAGASGAPSAAAAAPLR